MRFPNQLLLAAVCAVSLFTASCHREPNVVSTPTNATLSKTDAMQALNSLRSTPQNFTVTAGVYKRIKGAEGTLLTFYPNSFKDKNGNLITSGNVNIELVEMYKPGDMIANRTATVTENGVLTSGGEIDIRATMGGQEVFANKYGVGFKSAAPASKPMELYYGEANNADSITTWATRKMGQSDSASGTGYVTDSSLALWEAAYFLFDSCTSFEPINCDHPYNASSAYVTINVVFPDNTFKTAYSQLSLAFPSLNVATIMGSFEFNTNAHTMKFQGWVPTGGDCKFVLLIPKSISTFHYFEKTVTMSDGLTVNATMTQLSMDEVKAKLKAL